MTSVFPALEGSLVLDHPLLQAPLSLVGPPPLTLQSTPTLAAALTLTPSKEVEEMVSVLLKEADEALLIHLPRNLIIPSAISVSHALYGVSVNAAAPTEVFIHLARPRERAGVDYGLGGATSCGGAAGGRACQPPTPAVLTATEWCKAVSVSTGRRGLQPICTGEALTLLRESDNGAPTDVASSTPS